MESSKPTILLVWGYHRKGWIEPFEKLKDDFNFIYLFYLSRQKDEVKFTDCRHYYWFDFSSPYQLLKQIKPDKVVFMSIDKANSIALNIACKMKHISTFIFQHGMFYSLKFYIESNEKEINKNKELGISKWSDELSRKEYARLLLFLLSSIRLNHPEIFIFIIRFLFLKKKFGKKTQEFLRYINSITDYLKPTKYIVFTKENAAIFLERDHVSENELIEIGNPFLDEFFQDNYKKPFSEDYFLLIDEPLAYVGDFNSEGFFTKEDVINFQKKLNEFCLKEGKKLVIKLHPYSFDNDFYYQNENIIYLKDANNAALIRNASGIFGTSSTLLLPAVYLNKCVLFKVWEYSEFEEDCEQLGIVQKLDFFNFQVNEIDFNSFQKETKQLDQLIKKYFFKVDGKSTERLKDTLIQNEQL